MEPETAARLAIGLAALVGIAAPVRAQGANDPRGGAPVGLSLRDARAAAERRAPDVTLARGRHDIARAEVDVAGMLANPTVTVSTARETARLGTGISVPIPAFGQRATAIDAARADADAAERELAAVGHDARWSATMAWLDLWEAQERARLLGEAANDAARVADIASEKFKAGSAPRVEMLRTAADRERAGAEAAAAADAVPAAAARLAIVVGPPPAGHQWSASGNPDLALPNDALATLPREVDEHPLVRWERARVAAAAAHVRAEQRARWPALAVDVTANWRDPTLPATDVIAGLSLEAPVLSVRRGAIARARAEQRLAETTAALDQQRLTAALLDALGRARGAGTRARVLTTQVAPTLEEVWRMTQEGYRDGRIDLLRLLDAQRARLDTRIAIVDAQSTLDRALADVERASGARLDAGADGGR